MIKNNQIYIQTIKFKFKWINQKLIAYYRPPAPVANGTAALPSNPTATRCLEQPVPPDHQKIAPIKKALPSGH
jgi:hypothetical protein